MPLVPTGDVNRERVAGLFDLLVASGDLLELRHEIDGRSVRLLYLGPPSFIVSARCTYLLLGVRPLRCPAARREPGTRSTEGHTRAIQLDPATARSTLTAAGLHSVLLGSDG